MGSSGADAARELGSLLTGTEAREIADRLDDGDTMSVALKVVAPGRRHDLRPLLECCAGATVAVLRAIEGARSTVTSIAPIWTMPGHLAQGGALTNAVTHHVDGARVSVTCSTFNFQRTSGLWAALGRAARRPEIALRVYVDTVAARNGAPPLSEVAGHLRPGAVLRTRDFDGSPVRNHAKFLAIDHRFLIVTSANFSWSAEHGNVELGVLVDNPNLTDAVESELRRAETMLYERV